MSMFSKLYAEALASVQEHAYAVRQKFGSSSIEYEAVTTDLLQIDDEAQLAEDSYSAVKEIAEAWEELEGAVKRGAPFAPDIARRYDTAVRRCTEIVNKAEA